MRLQDLLSLIFLACLLTSCIIPEKDRDPLRSDYIDNYKFRSFYLYQSVLRIANINQNPKINKLIKDLDRVDVHIFKGEDPKADMLSIRKQLRKDGYEDLISTRMADQGRINLKTKNTGNKEKFALVGNANGRYLYVELQGHLNLEYLGEIGSVDWSKLTEQIGNNNFGLLDSN